MTTRKVYYEYLRILACALVVYNHTPAYLMYEETTGITQVVYLVLTMITRINVPLFLMVSGALLLEREEDYHRVLMKRALRILEVIVLFSCVYCALEALHHAVAGLPYEARIPVLLYRIAGCRIDALSSYWYLYTYLGFLLMLPLLQRAVRYTSRRDRLVAIGILLASHFVYNTAIPAINVFCSMRGANALELSSGLDLAMSSSKALFYPLLGYVLEHDVDITRLRGRHIVGLLAASVAVIALESWCTCEEYVLAGSYTQNYVQMADYVLTIAAFLLIKHAVTVRWSSLLQERWGKAVVSLGALTLGIYLLGPYCKLFLYSGYRQLFEARMPQLGFSLLWVVVDLCICGVVTWGLRHIPGIRRLV